MNADDILALTVNGLKSKLSELALQTSGRKSVLQDRLLEFYGIDIEEVVELDEERLEYSDAIKNPVRKMATFTLNDIKDTISTFNGTKHPKVEQWIREFEDNATILEWNDLQKFIYAKQLIEGAAQLWLRGQTNVNSWQLLQSGLEQEFGNKLSIAELHKKLANTRKRESETYLEFLYKIIEISKPLSLDDRSIIDYFISGIQDTEINKTVLYEATSLENLKEKIRIYEKIKKKSWRPIPNNNNRRTSGSNKICEFCPHLNNHSTSECKKANNLCFKCSKRGHKAADCRNQTINQNYSNNTQPNNYRNSNNTQPSNYRNNNNTQPNNYRNDSSTRNNQFNNFRNTSNPNNHRGNEITFHSNFCFIPRNIYIGIQVGNYKFRTLFDTGSHLTLITKSIFDQIKNTILIGKTININGLGNGKVQTLGYILERAIIDGIEFNWRFHVVNDEDIYNQPLLGCDILEILDVSISNDETSFRLKVEQKPLTDLLFVELLGTNEENNFTIINEFRAICQNEIIENELELGPYPAKLSKDESQQLENLVKNYVPNKTEKTTVETKIILTDEIPIRQKPRRISFQDQKIVENQILEWLENGIIRESQSEYAAPIVLVNKKNNTKRLCCDYRKLNDKMVKDNYPMVLIDDALAKLQNAKIFTTLDLKNGYFHVPVERNLQKYTAFVTHNGQYEFIKTPFGITNAPAVFCRYISSVFHKLIQNGTVIVYMDDIIIPSQSVTENINKLKDILNHASKHGLIFNFQKCQFVQTKISYLGYIIENSTIQPSSEKIKAVINFKDPKDTKSLQRFLGLTSYFRRFIKDYSSIAKPLTDLLPQIEKFTVNSEQKMAIEQLKLALSSSPILKIFNPHAATEVHSDASKYGFGAALMQKDAEDLKWHPIEYMSRKTTKLEQNYHAYELEVLAIINSLKKWRCYLMGTHFKIVTDCHAFTQTMKKKDVPPRIARWVIFLQDFDYEIEHRQGTRLKHVDALSRVHSFLIQSSLKHSVMEAQKNDDWTNALMKLSTKERYKDFYIKGNILYKDPTKELIVIPSSMEKQIIELAHRQGHVSKQKTIDTVGKDFYIKNITEKVTTIVNSCIECIVADAKTGKKEGLLNPINKSDRPLETLHIDHVRPLEKTQKQYNHILTVVDAFSKFIWLYPVKSTGTNEVLNALERQASIFGNPARIITDRGTAFTSQAFQSYCQENNISQHQITTGVPRGNGQVERIHRIVISLLTKLSVEKPQNWYKFIYKVQQTLNNTTNRSTKTTPFRILTGTEMRINGLDVIKRLLTEEEIRELEENREEIRNKAKQNIEKIQEENKKNFNKNRKVEKEYQIGDLVAIKRTQFGTGMKIKPKYLGPYKITKKKRLGRYEVEKLNENEGPKKTTTIAEHIKPWSTQFETRGQDSRM